MKPPYFWSSELDPKSREAAPVTRALLTPVSALYGAALGWKLARAQPHRAGPGVICVGNLTVGGVGKTPVVAAIRARLAGLGLRAASLSRGYGGRLKGPLRIDPARHDAGDVGDEPVMLAAGGEAWISRDRPTGAEAMDAAGVEVLVMDDGHQNPSLHKDLSILVIDAGAPFGNGHLLPKGPLREPVARGLARCDAIVLMGEGACPDTVSAAGRPVLRARLEPRLAPPPGALVAFAGIGRPQKFFDSLAAAGAELSETVPYPDHHAYSAKETDWLERLAGERGARLVTTEKDHVRLDGQMRERVLAWPVEACFEDDAALDALLAPFADRRTP
ncbi:MAG: tetraacyldisaccharide 4'-kinase [Alphaproteobacteria bacterium]|jgi:tetraacyldisaccharide 4'-kinase|nr:tetraacyldisaccharide 4'-kinase [Alphaproteobacteria bacterium]